MMINHNEFGVTEEDFVACDDDEEKVRAVLFQKMKNFITRHPEVSECLRATRTSKCCLSYDPQLPSSNAVRSALY